jgi:hypothetical protein
MGFMFDSMAQQPISHLQICDDGILIRITITILNIIHRPVFYLKLSPTL